jgi:hypothetical protein
MMRSDSFRELPAYGLLLRNAEIVMGNREAIPYLERSVEWFRSRDLPMPEAQSRISLAVNYIIDGQLVKAEEQLDRADLLMYQRTIKRHVSLNDRATILLVRSSPDPEGAAELLTLAMRTVTVDFDKIVILNNLLIAHGLMGGFDAVDDISHLLLPLIQNHSFTDLHRITYLNLSYAWFAVGEAGVGERYLELGRSMGDRGDPYFNHLLFGSATSDPDDEFMLRIPFRPAFLANWDTELADFIPMSH